ncbi:MAG: DUF2442 domain-containing protein [Nitrospirae bacterium]|nr:DUF2442 domain-containing protein [Nitrospirota bacterium]
MYYDILEARYIEGYKLELVFENGKKGIIDLSGYRHKGGVFSRFSAIEYFKQFYVNKEIGTLCWPDGVDIAPETLYHEATREPLPAWATPEKTAV